MHVISVLNKVSTELEYAFKFHLPQLNALQVLYAAFPAKLFFQNIDRNMDHRWSSMRTGARILTTLKISD